jgi:hypothetical protein
MGFGNAVYRWCTFLTVSLEVIKPNLKVECLVKIFNNRRTGMNHEKHTQVIKLRHCRVAGVSDFVHRPVF